MKSSISASRMAWAAGSMSIIMAPLEVGDGAGHCVQTLELLTRQAMPEAQPQCRAWSILGVARGVRSGTRELPDQPAPIGPLPCLASLTQWRRRGLGS
jgi:hypothetical protein